MGISMWHPNNEMMRKDVSFAGEIGQKVSQPRAKLGLGIMREDRHAICTLDCFDNDRLLGLSLTGSHFRGDLMPQLSNVSSEDGTPDRPTGYDQAIISARDESASVDPTSTSKPSVRKSRIRPLANEPISLAAARLASGHTLVEPKGKQSAAYLAMKRFLDILAALALLVVFSPIMLGAFLVLMVTTGGKPIFRQKRLGYLGRPFWMLKFRTMGLGAHQRRHLVANEKDGPIFKNRQDPRITRIGRFLRSTSIDEMPQLFNVLVGHMSLVGPRPPIGTEVAKYEPWQRDRLAVKPGLTCLWQISGRSEIAFEPWVRMDLWYVSNQSIVTDLALLVKTPWSVLTGRGAY